MPLGLLGDFVKGFIIYTIFVWVMAIIGLSASGQNALALLLLLVFMIPLSITAYEYLKNRKKQRT